MGKPKAPKSPDPKATAAAQTGTNVSTAIANAAMGNVNQVTPDGSLSWDQTGSYQWRDPSSGKTYTVPTWTATQSLSEQQQAIKEQTDAAELNMGKLANTQSNRLNDLLGTPLNLSDLPKAGDPTKVGMPQYQQFGSGPTLQTNVSGYGNIQNAIPSAGEIQTGVGETGKAQTALADAGQIGNQIADAGKVQTSLGDAGEITRSYQTDFSADRQRVEDAMFARLNPQIEQQRAALQTSLQNQGIRLGSDAWSNAMEDFNRGLNDQRTSVILGAGQEQSRLAGLANQAASFQNSAQQQAYNQAFGSGQFANAAQQQQFAQNAAQLEAQNAAQQQQFGQNLAEGQFANAGQQQNFNNALQAGQFANAAQGQQFEQNAAQAGFQNEAQAQAYQQAMANAQFGNATAQQMYQNQNTAAGANNALQDQSFNAGMAMVNAQNQQRQQALQEAYAARNQPINEISSLLSGAQVANPQWVNPNMPSIPTTDYAGLVQQDYANRVGAYNSQMAAQQGILGGLFGLGAAGIMASDRRLKRDVRRVGSYSNGLPKYEYRYAWNARRHIGLMSDDVRKVRPEAVVTVDGYDAVNYRKALA